MNNRAGEFVKELKNKRPELKVLEKVLMSEYTTFKIGGLADVAIYPETEEELLCAVDTARDMDFPYFVVGGGANLLVSDEGYRGAVIFTSGLTDLEFDGNRIIAGAGVRLVSLSRAAANRGLSGLEFASGIPGTLGGAVYMNAGAYGGEMKDVTLSSTFYSATLGRGTLTGEEQGFVYRGSAYTGSDKIILGAVLSLTPGDREEILSLCRENLDKRREKQPLEYPSAGSTFKRYPGRYTGQMIDEAGLRGFSIGGAEVSVKHAGFIINRGGATASDVVSLIRKVKEVILEKEGIEIECEVKYLAPTGEVKL